MKKIRKLGSFTTLFTTLIMLANILAVFGFRPQTAYADDCTFIIANATIPPHGSTTITINGPPNWQYLILFVGSTTQYEETADDSGTVTFSIDIDDIENASPVQGGGFTVNVFRHDEDFHGPFCFPTDNNYTVIVSADAYAGENPCPDGECETAIGTFSSNPQDFVGQVLSIAVGLAGGIAFILMVIGAIRVLTSTGNPQNVNAGRDMIVAALAGLIFIIFSVLILKFIGVNIIGL